MPSDHVDYQRFVEDALRDAVRRLLAQVAEQGLPGEHYFYLGFDTAHPGVVMPRSLRDLYPGEMTIVLQHQFWNLQVDPGELSVELSFGGSRQRLCIPFAAMTTFADPTADFALRFRPPGPVALAGKAPKPQRSEKVVKAEPSARKLKAAGPAAAGAPAAVPALGGSGGRARPAPAGKPTGKATGPEAPPARPSGRQGSAGGVIRFDPSRRK
jgi:uncharacterized protein